MRKWKKCLLLAAGMAAALSTAAMASQAKAGDSDYVTVEVKNTEGGAIIAYYLDENEDNVYLPIGEKVKIPRGTTVYATNGGGMNWHSNEIDEDIFSNIRNLYIKETGLPEVNIPIASEEIAHKVEADCIIDAEFKAEEVEIYGVGDEKVEVPEERKIFSVTSKASKYDSPSYATIDFKVTRGGESRTFSEAQASGLNLELGSSKANDERRNDNELFEVTSTGIRSICKLPVGAYRVMYNYTANTRTGRKMTKFANVVVGKFAFTELDLAEFNSFDGGTDGIWIWGRGLTSRGEEGNTTSYYDAATTTTADLLKILKQNGHSEAKIAGYTATGEYADVNGKLISEDNPVYLKDAGDPTTHRFGLFPILKKGDTEYKPAYINPIPDSKIVVSYMDSWLEKNGRLYYYDDGGELVKNQWVERGLKPVFCGEVGALVTNGIAGIPNDDEGMGLWYVDDKGHLTDITDTITIGMMRYTLVDGKVKNTGVVEEIATPSNASDVKNFVDGLSIHANDTSIIDNKKKTELADKLVDGLNNLLDTKQKNNLHDSVIEKADEVLKEVYTGEITTSLKNDTEDDAIEEVSAKGLLAAAGLTSENQKNVELKITRTDSNAAMKFDAKLYVGDSEDPTQLKSPVILDIEIPEDVQKLYSKYGYTYKLVHVGDGKTESVGDGETKNGLSLELSQDMTSMRIRTSSFSTFELQAVRKTSDDGTVTPGEPEKPAKPSEPENPIKPEDPSKPTTPETPNKPNKGNSSSSDRDDSDSSSSGSSYRRTKSSPSGQWVQDAKGWWYRRTDGSWPKSQWIELGWNGVNSWYYFNESGYMVTGWREDGGYTYYLNPVSDGTRGQMLTGWHQIDSIWYYFNKLTGGPQGSLVKNATTPDGYKVGADGAWLQ